MSEPAADDGFVELFEQDSLWDGEMEAFDVGDDEVLVVKVEGRIHAFDGICPHQSVSLVEGELEGTTLTCRAHEWQFDVVSGQSVNPAGAQLVLIYHSDGTDHQSSPGNLGVNAHEQLIMRVQ